MKDKTFKRKETFKQREDFKERIVGKTFERTSECQKCWLLVPDEDLDLENYIHHNGILKCKDRKACQKRVKKYKKRENK